VIWEPWPAQAEKLGEGDRAPPATLGTAISRSWSPSRTGSARTGSTPSAFDHALAEACRRVITDVPGTIKPGATLNENIDEATTRMATDNIAFQNRSPNAQDEQSY
jgi:hypothetical protein